MKAQEAEYYTKKEVAKKFKVSITTIDNWSRKGILKPYGVCRHVLFKVVDVDNVPAAI